MFNYINYTLFYLIKHITAFRILTFSVSILLVLPSALAWDLPYGVQDPMLGSGGWMNCEGHEIGHWNVVQRTAPDGRTAIYLILTSVDVIDPAFIICIVPPERKVMAMGPEKSL